MKKYWKHIRLVLLVILLIGLMSFANYRHSHKHLAQVDVEVFPFESLFITEGEVQKQILLDEFNKLKLNEITLNNFEHQLVTHDMIKQAQVYYSIDGILGIEVIQRRPILRFIDGGSHYLDEDGEIMPLSKNYAARVPVAFGFTSANIKDVFPLLKAIEKDQFLSQHVIGLTNQNNGLYLSLREAKFEVVFGEINEIELKLKNLKAFYAKAKKEDKLAAYKQVDLRFGNQVVCTKI
ncbi:cell division protein FtsQ/DivIB [Psychroflexus maritimus]|uniref:Cell division protein FtsQ n=1 Tax=Psychroflexus maritimus TaxID=2714865 RepID=A0A967AE59_9FLAO|nr:cell division protein FtsQ/DivIB [Psychroflexus maritimus]NGZ88831.1 cell division protein FtsQ [Psychroflexus maritimus]